MNTRIRTLLAEADAKAQDPLGGMAALRAIRSIAVEIIRDVDRHEQDWRDQIEDKDRYASGHVGGL